MSVQSASRAPSTRACPNDTTEMTAGWGHECPTCGWRMGLIVIGEGRDTDGTLWWQFAAEQPSRFGRAGMLTALLAALVLVALGAGVSTGAGLVAAAVLIVVGVVAVETRLGRVTWGQTRGMQVLARVIIAVGVVLAFCTVIGFVIGMSGDRILRNL
jgi:hypothetical protein